MAKYTVDHACGHQQEVNLVGKHTERDRKLAWMATQDCPECRTAALKAATAAKAKEILEKGLDSQWPALTGTEKQIDWAITVRVGLLSAAEKFAVEAEAKSEENKQKYPDEAERIDRGLYEIGLALDHLRKRSDARFWIDHRGDGAQSLLKDALAEIKAEEESRAKQEAERASAEKVRALAVRARELFGSDVADFTVSIWTKGDDKRVYVGEGYGANWVEYHHTGNARVAPGTLTVTIPAVVRGLAAHLGVSEAEAKAQILEYCREVATAWKSIKVEVTPANAPPDPAAVRDVFAICGPADLSQPETSGKEYVVSPSFRSQTREFGKAKLFRSEAEARAAIPSHAEALIDTHKVRDMTDEEKESYMARVIAAATVERRVFRTAFPPRAEATNA